MNKPAVESTVLTFTLFSAVAMLLGWGLRGYIGGGPFAAMIPGAFVAMGLSLMLGHNPRMAATVAIFGALGIGYGGDMTYGQTLGLAKETETMWWGLIGVTVKGAVWGFLGGAVLGVGLTRRHYDYKSLATAFVLTIVAFYLGWKLVNEPRLIYFSDPLNKPREESWAGLLFAAIAFLGYLRTRTAGAHASIPLHFALWGALGGGLGFGGGTLWMVIGPHLPVPKEFFSWWKAMEFSFGFLLGAFLGLCAWIHRAEIGDAPEPAAPRRTDWVYVGIIVAFVALVFVVFPPVMERLGAMVSDASPWKTMIAMDAVRILGSFIFFGAVCILVGMRSIAAAWQIAITLTFFHTVFDLVMDMTGEKPNLGYSFSTSTIVAIILVTTGVIGALTAILSRSARPVTNLYLLLVWACFTIATVRTFGRENILFPQEGTEGGLGHFITTDPTILIVYAVFTGSTLITTAYILRLSSPPPHAA